MNRIALLPLVACWLLFPAACREPPAPPTDGTPAAFESPAAVPGPAPTASALDEARASSLAELSLSCLDRSYPNKPGHVLEGAGDARPPREFTPAFFGCFDWHSAVHGHWALVRLLGRLPGWALADRVRAALAAHLNSATLTAELAFFEQERNRIFERPYGWGWYLRLCAELAALDDPQGREWLAAARPLAEFLARRLADYLERLSAPVRAGTHDNTAFSLSHARDAATALGMADLRSAIDRAARRFYLADRDCPTHFEPSGEDFLSPCLAEADLMRRVLPPPEFAAWLQTLLPPPDSARFAPLATPPEVRDPQDPRLGHLIGLCFHRAWTLRGVASALAPAHPWRAAFLALSDRHRDAGLHEMQASGYGGEHWLASFAIYLLTDTGS